MRFTIVTSPQRRIIPDQGGRLDYLGSTGVAGDIYSQEEHDPRRVNSMRLPVNGHDGGPLFFTLFCFTPGSKTEVAFCLHLRTVQRGT